MVKTSAPLPLECIFLLIIVVCVTAISRLRFFLKLSVSNNPVCANTGPVFGLCLQNRIINDSALAHGYWWDSSWYTQGSKSVWNSQLWPRGWGRQGVSLLKGSHSRVKNDLSMPMLERLPRVSADFSIQKQQRLFLRSQHLQNYQCLNLISIA